MGILETESATERLGARARLNGKDSEDERYGQVDLHCVRPGGKKREVLTRLYVASVHQSKYPTYHGHPAKLKASNIALLVHSLDLRKAERVRRDQIRDSINALDADQQNGAWEAELQQRQIWNQRLEEHRRKEDVAGNEEANPQVDDQASPTSQPSSQPIPQPIPQPSSQPSSQPRWWKRIFIKMRVKGALRGKSDLEASKIPRSTGEA